MWEFPYNLRPEQSQTISYVCFHVLLLFLIKEIAISDDFDEVTTLMQEIESDVVPKIAHMPQSEIPIFLFTTFSRKVRSQFVPRKHLALITHCFL